MNTDNKNPDITPDGAVELDETKLEQAAGGASDFLLQLDGVKGESTSKISGQRAQKVHPSGIIAGLGDGSVKF